MKKGICLTAVYPEAMYHGEYLIQCLERTAEQRLFQCVEFYFNGTDKEILDIRRALKRLELKAVFLAGYPLKQEKADITSPREAERIRGMELCRELYDRALRLGAVKMLVLSGPAWSTKDEENLIARTRKTCMELTRLAAGGNTEITMEFFPEEGEPYLAVGRIPLVRKIWEGMKENQVGITFDTSHAMQMKEDIYEGFRTLRPWIHHLHLANSISGNPANPLYGDKHPLFDVEEGDFSLDQIRTFYRKMTEENRLKHVDICSLEVISRGKEEEYFQDICRQAKEIWK